MKKQESKNKKLLFLKKLMKNKNCLEFTSKKYRQLLKLSKKKYKFRLFTNFSKDENFILFRHDVDYSIQDALKLAMIEYEEGVNSTFFLLPHSEYYNLLESESRDIIFKLQELGHDIGLHFDSHYYDIRKEEELEKCLNKEVKIFKKLFDIDIEVFSFHNTTSFTMNCTEPEYAGLINVYSEYFQNEVKYNSDSNGYWRFESIFDILKNKNYPRLQFLSHPVWWQERKIYPREKIYRTIFSRLEKTIELYDNTLEKNDRKNISQHLDDINFFKEYDYQIFKFFDLLWVLEKFDLLFYELWMYHRKQLVNIIREEREDFLENKISKSKSEITELIDFIKSEFSDDDMIWKSVTGYNINTHLKWYNFLESEFGSSPDTSQSKQSKLEEGCRYMCTIIRNIENWRI